MKPSFFEEGDVVTLESFREGTSSAQTIEWIREHFGAGPFVVRSAIPDGNSWRYTLARMPNDGGQLLRKVLKNPDRENKSGTGAAFFHHRSLKKRINSRPSTSASITPKKRPSFYY